MTLIETIKYQIRIVIYEGVSRIISCSEARISCEGWFKVELLNRLREVYGIEVLPEYKYTDFCIKLGMETILLELKTFPTNYGRRGKPITKCIKEVIKDINKLSKKCTNDEKGYSFWMAYPVPLNKKEKWKKHLLKVSKEAQSSILESQIELADNKYAHFYIMECPYET